MIIHSKDCHRGPVGLGTKTSLSLKEDQTEFSEERVIKEIMRKCSQFIG